MYLFTPPSLHELKQRLLKRGMEENSNLELRLISAEREVAEGAKYDYKIVNENFKKSWSELKKIIEKELILT